MSKKNMSKENVTEDNAADESVTGGGLTKESASELDMPENDISEEEETAIAGQKDNRAARSGNLLLLRISIALLLIFCAVLLVRIHGLDKRIEDMAARTEYLLQMAAQQQEAIKELTEEPAVTEEKEEISPKNAPQNGDLSGDAEGVTGEDNGEMPVREVEAAHKVYLTFDDGPSANTLKILDILEEYGVKATFFTVGTAGEGEEEILKQIVEAGHTLGMHSYTHDYSELYSSVENFAADFAREQEFLYGVTGVKSKVYRFPGGSSNTVSGIDMKEFAEYLDRQGVRFFDWNVSSGDGGSHLFPVETIVENCTGNIGSYSVSVILMHDSAGKTTTLEALPIIIEKIQAMEDTVILPITDATVPVQHIRWKDEADTQTR